MKKTKFVEEASKHIWAFQNEFRRDYYLKDFTSVGRLIELYTDSMENLKVIRIYEIDALKYSGWEILNLALELVKSLDLPEFKISVISQNRKDETSHPYKDLTIRYK